MPYIYTQLIPAMIAIYRKMTGKASTSWTKTERTAKKQI
jgi:hypothetical protein